MYTRNELLVERKSHKYLTLRSWTTLEYILGGISSWEITLTSNVVQDLKGVSLWLLHSSANQRAHAKMSSRNQK